MTFIHQLLDEKYFISNLIYKIISRGVIEKPRAKLLFIQNWKMSFYLIVKSWLRQMSLLPIESIKPIEYIKLALSIYCQKYHKVGRLYINIYVNISYFHPFV